MLSRRNKVRRSAPLMFLSDEDEDYDDEFTVAKKSMVKKPEPVVQETPPKNTRKTSARILSENDNKSSSRAGSKTTNNDSSKLPKSKSDNYVGKKVSEEVKKNVKPIEIELQSGPSSSSKSKSKSDHYVGKRVSEAVKKNIQPMQIEPQPGPSSTSAKSKSKSDNSFGKKAFEVVKKNVQPMEIEFQPGPSLTSAKSKSKSDNSCRKKVSEAVKKNVQPMETEPEPQSGPSSTSSKSSSSRKRGTNRVDTISVKEDKKKKSELVVELPKETKTSAPPRKTAKSKYVPEVVTKVAESPDIKSEEEMAFDFDFGNSKVLYLPDISQNRNSDSELEIVKIPQKPERGNVQDDEDNEENENEDANESLNTSTSSSSSDSSGSSSSSELGSDEIQYSPPHKKKKEGEPEEPELSPKSSWTKMLKQGHVSFARLRKRTNCYFDKNDKNGRPKVYWDNFSPPPCYTPEMERIGYVSSEEETLSPAARYYEQMKAEEESWKEKNLRSRSERDKRRMESLERLDLSDLSEIEMTDEASPYGLERGMYNTNRMYNTPPEQTKGKINFMSQPLPEESDEEEMDGADAEVVEINSTVNGVDTLNENKEVMKDNFLESDDEAFMVSYSQHLEAAYNNNTKVDNSKGLSQLRAFQKNSHAFQSSSPVKPVSLNDLNSARRKLDYNSGNTTSANLPDGNDGIIQRSLELSPIITRIHAMSTTLEPVETKSLDWADSDEDDKLLSQVDIPELNTKISNPSEAKSSPMCISSDDEDLGDDYWKELDLMEETALKSTTSQTGAPISNPNPGTGQEEKNAQTSANEKAISKPNQRGSFGWNGNKGLRM